MGLAIYPLSRESTSEGGAMIFPLSRESSSASAGNGNSGNAKKKKKKDKNLSSVLPTILSKLDPSARPW